MLISFEILLDTEVQKLTSLMENKAEHKYVSELPHSFSRKCIRKMWQGQISQTPTVALNPSTRAETVGLALSESNQICLSTSKALDMLD